MNDPAREGVAQALSRAATANGLHLAGTRDALTDAVLAVVARREAALREDIARAIESAQGVRCPQCGATPASSSENANTHQTVRLCGGGHTWAVGSRARWINAAGIARGAA